MRLSSNVKQIKKKSHNIDVEKIIEGFIKIVLFLVAAVAILAFVFIVPGAVAKAAQGDSSGVDDILKGSIPLMMPWEMDFIGLTCCGAPIGLIFIILAYYFLKGDS